MDSFISTFPFADLDNDDFLYLLNSSDNISARTLKIPIK